MTSQQELLWNQHIDDEDYEGAAGVQVPQNPADQLRTSADRYLDHAVATGVVTVSPIFFSDHQKKYVGYTAVETTSGVAIRKSSAGDFSFEIEYDEPTAAGGEQDLTVEIDMPIGSEPVVRENRFRKVNGERTGESGSRTLKKAEQDYERTLGDIALFIWRVY